MAAAPKPFEDLIPLLGKALGTEHIPRELSVGALISFEDFVRVIRIDGEGLGGLTTKKITEAVAQLLVKTSIKDLYIRNGGSSKITARSNTAAATLLRSRIKQSLQEARR